MESSHGIDTSSPANPGLPPKVPKKPKGVNIGDSIISSDSDKPSDGATDSLESSDAIPKLNFQSHWDRKLMEADVDPERLKRIFDNRKAVKKFINKKAEYSTKLEAQIIQFQGITSRLKDQVDKAMEVYMKQRKENHHMKMRVAVLEIEEDDFMFNLSEKDRLYKKLLEQERQKELEEERKNIEELEKFLLETSTS